MASKLHVLTEKKNDLVGLTALIEWLGTAELSRLYSAEQEYTSWEDDAGNISYGPRYVKRAGTLYRPRPFYIESFNKLSCAVHVVASDNPRQTAKYNRIEYDRPPMLHRVKRDELLPLMGKKYLDRPIFEQILKGKKARVD